MDTFSVTLHLLLTLLQLLITYFVRQIDDTPMTHADQIIEEQVDVVRLSPFSSPSEPLFYSFLPLILQNEKEKHILLLQRR
jgi:hypothetical protein